MGAYDFLQRRKNNIAYNGNPDATLGKQLKVSSDIVMEDTWWHDPQSKVAYIYDYFHDDQPHLNKGMTYEHTTKTRIDIKFIITAYGSLSKDQVEYHIMFKPSQKIVFDERDELYYFTEDYVNRYRMDFPVGLYIDIPDDRGVYVKWLILDIEYGNQFIKYSALPCDYRLQWIEAKDNKRLKRQMWCCARAMNSYTTGLWVDRYFNTPDDVGKAILPLNNITEKLYYKREDGTNTRVIYDILTDHPSTWKISKVERTKPVGAILITLDQDEFNPNTDYVNIPAGEMYADYWISNVEPENPIDNNAVPPTDTPPVVVEPETPQFSISLSAPSDNLRVGGSYKTINITVLDGNLKDITEESKDLLLEAVWTANVNGVDVVESGDVKWLAQDNAATMKIKFLDNPEYYDTVLTVNCELQGIIGSIQFELQA